jgi:glyoxylase-like metal-dependent hydrolase (beta-lactamase superfamily II)
MATRPPSLDRRSFLTASATAAALLATDPRGLLARSVAQPAPSNFSDLRGGVGIFSGQGGTIGWFIGPDGAVIIDSQFPRTAEPCRKGLLSRSEKGLSLLVNTHHHGDHTGGNAIFKSDRDGKGVGRIVAHAKVPALQKAQATSRGSEAGQVYADTTFETTWKQDLGAETLHAKHYGPAHTGGDIVVRFEKANVAHLGDLVFNRAHPFIDPAGGGSIIGWPAVLQAIHDDFDDDAAFIFGHGQPAHGVVGRRKDIALMRDYFRRAIDTVEAGRAAKLSREEIAAKTPEGFEPFVSFNERMSLRATLEKTWDELEAKSASAEEE